MGIRDWFTRQPTGSAVAEQAKPQPSSSYAYAANNDNDVTLTYNDKAITYSGDIVGYDYNGILRDKQGNINNIYQLADYFVDSEELFGGAIKWVYTPFSLTEGWYIIGGNDKTRAKYMEYYERIHLEEKLESWFYQYYVYGNVYFSIQDDGDIVTLPPHLCRISNVMIHGNPVVEFNCKSVRDDLKKQGNKAFKKYLEDEDIQIRLSGYPQEVTLGLKQGKDWVQLNPSRTFCWQNPKEEWKRYAIPMIVSCLKPLGKKALISKYEDALLNLGATAFVHATVGSPPDSNIVVDLPTLSAVNGIVKKAMTGSALATTNDMVKCEVIQPDMEHMFDNDKYKGVNEDILGGLGINNSVSSGTDSSISFGSAQISTKMVSQRINEAKRTFCTLMNRINLALNGSPYGLPQSNKDKIPTFKMPITDLTTVSAFRQECMKLWEAGMLSNETLLTNYGLDLQMEYDRKKQEKAEGQDDVFTKPGVRIDTSVNAPSDGDNDSVGRPTLDDDERNSDPGNSETGRNPKPSNEEGSEAQE